MIQKILIANRGEIAIRVMRSAREMGIKTVAVYSDVDRNAKHVRFADEAVHIGESPSAKSYLLIDKIIEAALKTKCDAIHPGYGFLSENESFAKKVEESGIVFIGPSPDSIRIMGNKLAAKEAVAKYNVPMVPGTPGAISDFEEAKKIAQEIGFPVLIKAAAGGGGKGMRVVEREDVLQEQMQLAQNEARSAFGDDSVFIEKYIGSPKHIEVQVLGDKHGNIVHLFERECSVQRRHQKVIEEAPSAVITPEIRAQLGKTAVNVAQSVNYVGAGTVEFILDEHKNFYFLEMNTRLQVEHPVTEMISGVDLVKEQINIAAGKSISFKQEGLKINGHALELRIYAEDPQNNFLPDIGKLIQYNKPEGIGVRVDDGYEEGMDIPIYYDPMIAKLIVHDKNREEACKRMVRAIDEYKITGIKNTLTFGKFVVQHPAFLDGSFDTHFVKDHFTPEVLNGPETDEISAQVALNLFLKAKPLSSPAQKTNSSSNWVKNRKMI